MSNTHCRLDGGPARLPLVVTPLLALLLIFLSSLSYQQSYFPQSKHGFVGEPSSLALLNHQQSIRLINARLQSNNSADDHPDFPDLWHQGSLLLFAELSAASGAITAYAPALRSFVLFLNPQLRAPPLV